MEPVQFWGIACVMVSMMAAIHARSKADLEPRLPKLLTPLDAFIATVGLYGFFMVGIVLIFLPLMI